MSQVLDPGAGRMLRAAADAIETHGWVRGRYGNKNDGFCTMGAIFYACDYTPYRNRVSVTFASWLGSYLGVGYLGGDYGGAHIPDWNDRLVSGPEEVVATLRKAADDLDPQQ